MSLLQQIVSVRTSQQGNATTKQAAVFPHLKVTMAWTRTLIEAVTPQPTAGTRIGATRDFRYRQICKSITAVGTEVGRLISNVQSANRVSCWSPSWLITFAINSFMSTNLWKIFWTHFLEHLHKVFKLAAVDWIFQKKQF